MGWVALADPGGGVFAPRGLTPHSNDSGPAQCDEAALLVRGTLLLQTRLSPDRRPQTLLGLRAHRPWVHALSIQALPGGGCILVDAQGDDIRHATLPMARDGRADVVRLSYSWDAPRRTARLSLERIDSDVVESVAMSPPHPLPLADTGAALRDPRLREMDRDVTFAALSDRPEPVGPMPGLTAQAPVLTPNGEVPAQQVRPGDCVITQSGAVVRVLRVVSRAVPARGSFCPVRLRAPYFGLTRDIVVAPQKRLVLGGSQVEYMFGKEAVLVPARHLIDGVSALYDGASQLVSYYDFLLPEHEVLCVAGAPVESLYIGRLRRKPDLLAASVLDGIGSGRLPEHAKPAWPVLKPFEAVSLALNRAA